MGYESKFIVVEKSQYQMINERCWSEVICIFDMCKMYYNGPFHKIIYKLRETDCFFYFPGKEEPIIEDLYGNKIKECTVPAMIKILEKENKEYRRIQPFISLLKGFDLDKWGNLMVLHYGH